MTAYIKIWCKGCFELTHQMPLLSRLSRGEKAAMCHFCATVNNVPETGPEGGEL